MKKLLLSTLFCASLLPAAVYASPGTAVERAASAASGVATRTEGAVKRGVKRAASAVEHGVQKAGAAVQKGARKVGLPTDPPASDPGRRQAP